MIMLLSAATPVDSYIKSLYIPQCFKDLVPKQGEKKTITIADIGVFFPNPLSPIHSDAINLDLSFLQLELEPTTSIVDGKFRF